MTEPAIAELIAAGRLVEADSRLKTALAADPNNPELHFQAANVARDLGRVAEAEAGYRGLLAAMPAAVPVLKNLATLVQEDGRLEEAESLLLTALRQAPEAPPLWIGLGIVFHLSGRAAEAAEALAMAASLAPMTPAVESNRALVAEQIGDFIRFRLHSLRAVALLPGSADLHFQLALARLASGDLEDGWRGFEWRHGLKDARRTTLPRLPRWQGEAAADLFVTDEQGLGDALRSVTCLNDLSPSPRSITMEADPRLIPALERSFPAIRFVPPRRDITAPLPEGLSHFLPLGTLPALTRRRISDFPADGGGVLIACPKRRRAMRERLNALGAGPHIGIAWRTGNRNLRTAADIGRLADWAPILRAAPGPLINLQYDDCAAELDQVQAATGIAVHRWPDLDLRDDLETTFALIAELDLVLAPAISVNDMAGVIGTPCWVIRSQPTWVSLGTDRLPSYPGHRLFHGQDGEPPIDRVAAALRDLKG